MTGGYTLLLVVGLLLVMALCLVARPLARLGGLALRSCGGLCALALLQQVGVGLGVNLLNALVLGVLGVPGLGLLMLLQWVLH